jgi:hypothetical protein
MFLTMLPANSAKAAFLPKHYMYEYSLARLGCSVFGHTQQNQTHTCTTFSEVGADWLSAVFSLLGNEEHCKYTLRHPVALCVLNCHSQFSPPPCNFVDVFTLQNIRLFLLFEHYMFRPNSLPTSGVQVVEETATPVSRCYTLHFKGVK